MDASRKRNFVVMGFVVLWQDHTFVMKCILNVLCLLSHLNLGIGFSAELLSLLPKSRNTENYGNTHESMLIVMLYY